MQVVRGGRQGKRNGKQVKAVGIVPGAGAMVARLFLTTSDVRYRVSKRMKSQFMSFKVLRSRVHLRGKRAKRKLINE